MSKHLHPTSISYLIVFFLLFISISAQSIDFSYPNCPSYDCGNVTISYPFWRIDSEPSTQNCGYQGFGINCSDDGRNISTVILGGNSYYVKSINYEYRSIVLIDYEVSPVVVDVPDCPRVQHNIELETLPLNFSVFNVNLSFHFNCNRGEFPSFTTPLPCLGDVSYVNIFNSESERFDWDRLSCDQEVVTTVFHVFHDEDITLPGQWETAVRRGFELKWGRIDVCNMCEESDGRCGSHSTTGFMCFCPDGTTAKRDCKGRKVYLTPKLVLGLGSAFLTAVLLLIIYCKKKSSPSDCVTPFVHKSEDHQSVEAFVIQYGSLTMKRYNYHDIKKMTKSVIPSKIRTRRFWNCFQRKAV